MKSSFEERGTKANFGRVSTNLIYTAADGAYALQAKVLLKSLEITQAQPTQLIIFGNGWTSEDKQDVEKLRKNSVTAEVRPVDEGIFSHIRLTNGFPLATAYNVLAPEYLLQESGRALYLDADVVVCEDLDHLWNSVMTETVSAVVDAHVAVMGSPSMWRPWREEGVDPLVPYLNTGALLIDLDRWKAREITSQVVGYLSKYELPCVDQDALNLTLRGAFGHLHPRYNMMPYHMLNLFRNIDMFENDENIGEALQAPSVIHFHRSFFGKPWEIGCTHPAKKIWRDLASQVDSHWRRSVNIKSLLRGQGAKFAKMMQTDPRALSLVDKKVIPGGGRSGK
jgi:lipopolysaccharide biosynthesis glycosyltransferase